MGAGTYPIVEVDDTVNYAAGGGGGGWRGGLVLVSGGCVFRVKIKIRKRWGGRG